MSGETVAVLDMLRWEVVVPALPTAGVARVLGGVTGRTFHLELFQNYHGPLSLSLSLPLSLTLVSCGLGGVCILQLYMLLLLGAGAG